MYTEENNVLYEEENDYSPRRLLFMALIQDENITGGKSSTKVSPTRISKYEKEWTYNGIYFPSRKYDEMLKTNAPLMKLHDHC